MKTFKSLLAVLGVLFLVGSFAGAVELPEGYVANVGYAEVESDTAPVFKNDTIHNGLCVGENYARIVGATEDESPYLSFDRYYGILGKCNYTAEGLPDGLKINAKRGIIYGTVSAAEGFYTATITATNSYGSDTIIFTFTVSGVENALSAKYRTGLLITENGIASVITSDNLYYGEKCLVPTITEYGIGVCTFDGADYPVGKNNFVYDGKTAGATLYVIDQADLEGEWDFNTPDTGDTGATITVSDETPVMAFAATQEVTTDDEEVVADLEVAAPAVATPTVADVLRGNVTQFNYDLYVMLEIGDGILFITDTGTSKDLTGDTKEFTKKIKSGKHRIFDLQMTPILRLALKGVKVKWYAGCISDDMEVCGQIATATTEFK